jgi:hypothetical protein
MAEYVIYKDEKFRIQTSGRYYQSGRKLVKERLLHRRVWSDNYGDIPDGYIVHHKDHDWRNNDISNLEIVLKVDHLKQHAIENFLRPEYRDQNKKNLDEIRHLTVGWHKSDEGLAWHSKHGKQTWENRKSGVIKCLVCGKEKETVFVNRESTRYCSIACSRKVSFKNYFTDKRCCIQCGNEFMANRHRKTKYCSRNCSNKHRFSNEQQSG